MLSYVNNLFSFIHIIEDKMKSKYFICLLFLFATEVFTHKFELLGNYEASPNDFAMVSFYQSE